jgi:hypothetical protein
MTSTEPTVWTAPAVERTWAPPIADERGMLQAWLDFHRGTLLTKCAGLTADQLRTAAVPPSNLTLLGLVRHMAFVERIWFRQRIAGEPVEPLYSRDDAPDADFEEVADADPAEAIATFTRECAAADAAVRDRSLDDTFVHPRRGDTSIRWVYVHMVEEYARHNGHADLIRERLDGATGD